MPMRTVRADDLVDVQQWLLSAAAGDASFDQVLDVAMRAFDGRGAAIFESDCRTGEVYHWYAIGLDAGQSEYRERIHHINPRVRHSLPYRTGEVMSDDWFIDERGMDHHEFYDWLQRHDNYRYFVGARVLDTGIRRLLCSIEFTKAQGGPGRDRIEAFRCLVPGIGHAWRLAQRCDRFGQSRSGWAPDHLPWAIFVLSAEAKVVDTNRAARGLLREGSAVCVTDGVLEAVDRRCILPLRRAIAQAMADESSETLLRRAGGGMPLVAQIVPAGFGIGSGPDAVRAVVYIWDPRNRGATIGPVLERLFKFTPAEVRLAQKLAMGLRLADAAEQLQIAPSTARNQLQSMFAKTGTRRQADFVAQILGVLDTGPPAARLH